MNGEERQPNAERKAVKLYIEYADGTAEQALGNDATEIWAALVNADLLMRIRSGVQWTGPNLQKCELASSIQAEGRQEIERLTKELAENEAEDSRQFKLYEEWRDRAHAAEKQLAEARAQVDAARDLAGWLEHKSECKAKQMKDWIKTGQYDCSCGLTAAIERAAEAQKDRGEKETEIK